MTAARRLASATGAPSLVSSSVRFVDDVADLTAIFDQRVNVVTLRRPPSPALVDEVRRAASEAGVAKRFAATADAAAMGTIAEALAGFPHLAADVQFWVEALAELTGCDDVGVRLARVDTAMCPRLHVDRVTLRAVCTYEGRGTEFVSNEHLDRRRLGHAAKGAADEDSGLLLVPGCVRAAAAFDIVLLKGEAWPENAGRGAVHRSPAASEASPRLVMTLDPL
jgi:hypothetical protein